MDPKWQPQGKKDLPSRKKIQEWYREDREYYGHNALCVSVEELFTVEECERLIEYSYSKGYEKAMVNIGGSH